jgi:hypothetical protein
VLTLHEHIEENGVRVSTTIDVVDGDLAITVDGIALGSISREAIGIIFDRYAKPLADGVSLDGCPSLDLGDGSRICALRHRAIYDVIARDFVVLVRRDREPYAELSTMIAGAATHIAQASSRARSGSDR